MSTDDQVVEIAGTQVLIYREQASWFWRGDDWTSHMKSFGAFDTKDAAIESARRYFTLGSSNQHEPQ